MVMDQMRDIDLDPWIRQHYAAAAAPDWADSPALKAQRAAEQQAQQARSAAGVLAQTQLDLERQAIEARAGSRLPRFTIETTPHYDAPPPQAEYHGTQAYEAQRRAYEASANGVAWRVVVGGKTAYYQGGGQPNTEVAGWAADERQAQDAAEAAGAEYLRRYEAAYLPPQAAPETAAEPDLHQVKVNRRARDAGWVMPYPDAGLDHPSLTPYGGLA